MKSKCKEWSHNQNENDINNELGTSVIFFLLYINEWSHLSSYDAWHEDSF